MGHFKPTRLSHQENMVMLMFSLLYTLNIAVSNVALQLVKISLHQIIRAMTPLFTIGLSVMVLKKQYPSAIYISLIPIVAGVTFTSLGDLGYKSSFGLFLTVLSAFLAALKTVVTNRVQVGKLKLHPMDVLYRMSPLAFIQSLMYARLTGELTQVSDFWYTQMTPSVFLLIALNGVMAFFLNVVSFTSNGKTSALMMTVAGNVKQVLTILVVVPLFGETVTALGGFGIVLTLMGGAWYTMLEFKEKNRKMELLGGR
ncbi:uncharacterized protein VTP21DRAFT_3142 [Calcarisporiella thermophila]|uniref:uncharacterized protein n=1 Tax=Calcarisporiella thermophila TaxID=911321 RepID=UPI003741F187